MDKKVEDEKELEVPKEEVKKEVKKEEPCNLSEEMFRNGMYGCKTCGI